MGFVSKILCGYFFRKSLMDYYKRIAVIHKIFYYILSVKTIVNSAYDYRTPALEESVIYLQNIQSLSFPIFQYILI